MRAVSAPPLPLPLPVILILRRVRGPAAVTHAPFQLQNGSMNKASLVLTTLIFFGGGKATGSNKKMNENTSEVKRLGLGR